MAANIFMVISMPISSLGFFCKASARSRTVIGVFRCSSGIVAAGASSSAGVSSSATASGVSSITCWVSSSCCCLSAMICRRTRSASSASMELEWLRAVKPSFSKSSNKSLLFMPNSLANSYTLIFSGVIASPLFDFGHCLQPARSTCLQACRGMFFWSRCQSPFWRVFSSGRVLWRPGLYARQAPRRSPPALRYRPG